MLKLFHSVTVRTPKTNNPFNNRLNQSLDKSVKPLPTPVLKSVKTLINRLTELILDGVAVLKSILVRKETTVPSAWRIIISAFLPKNGTHQTILNANSYLI